MKLACRDITFLILIRQDSVQRLENIVAITQLFSKYLDSRVVVLEAASVNNHLLESLLSRKITYKYVEDKDPVLYRTHHYNEMIRQADTPYIGIWDADIVPDPKAIMESMEYLRSRKAFVSYPYNGHCLDVPEIIKNLFLQKKRIQTLYRHKNKMNYLHPQILSGGAVLLNKQKFVEAGLENEMHYGWGNEDYDRSIRLAALNYPAYRVNVPLFHLSHPRGNNSIYSSDYFKKISINELMQLYNQSDLITHPSIQLLR